MSGRNHVYILFQISKSNHQSDYIKIISSFINIFSNSRQVFFFFFLKIIFFFFLSLFLKRSFKLKISFHLLESMNQGGNVSQRPKSKDPGWKYNKWAYPGDKNSVRCNFCGFISKAGICRAKQHLIGGYRNVRNCEKVPDDVKAELIEYVERQKAKKNNDDYQDYAIDLEDGGYGDDEPDEDEAVENEAVENQNTRNKRARVEKPTSSRS